MQSQTDTSRAALAGPPRVDAEKLADAVLLQFGLSGEFTELVSERDRNFRLRTADGKAYVVKATSLAEDAVVTDFQIAALVYMEKRGVDGVPRIVRTLSGQDRGVIESKDGRAMCLRVVTWLDGRLMGEFEMTPRIAAGFGKRLAELDAALEEFSHEGENQILLWDSQRAGELRGLLSHVNDSAVLKGVEAVLDDFDSRVEPALADLPRQVIHNDANEDNVLLNDDGDVAGIIDFGDMMRAPRIVDVATAASYLRTVDDPLHLIKPFVVAYHEENALLPAELDVLLDLIRTRLAMTLIILYWRLAARDEDDPYRQKSIAVNRNALDFLQKLSGLGRETFLERLQS